MKTIQLHIPDELAEKVSRITENAETLILDLLRIKVNETNKPVLLADEYRMAGKENAHLMEDFAHTDMEGWDDEY